MKETKQGVTTANVQTPEQLRQVWAFACGVLPLPLGIHTLAYYAEQLGKTPQLLVYAERQGQVCGCALSSIEGDHILLGPVAVAADVRRLGIGAAMLSEVETAARSLGYATLLLGAQQEAEPFYLACGYEPNLFVQVPDEDALERMKALSAGHAIIWETQQGGYARLMLRTTAISRELQSKYDQAFPAGGTQYIFIKHL